MKETKVHRTQKASATRNTTTPNPPPPRQKLQRKRPANCPRHASRCLQFRPMLAQHMNALTGSTDEWLVRRRLHDMPRSTETLQSERRRDALLMTDNTERPTRLRRPVQTDRRADLRVAPSNVPASFHHRAETRREPTLAVAHPPTSNSDPNDVTPPSTT
jgi:hypothetical protein